MRYDRTVSGWLCTFVLTASASGCFIKPEPPASANDGGADARVIDGVTLDGPGETPNYMFVTSGTYNFQNIGGLAGADAMCMAEKGPLPGNYVAWVSSSSTNAIDRLGSARGWIRADHKPFADKQSDLAGGAIFYPPILDANGLPLDPSTMVMTGTNANGTDGLDCFATSFATVGYAGGGTGEWTNNTIAEPCLGSYHMYCFATDKVVPVGPPAPTGKLAFSSSSNPGGSGLGALDVTCQNDATATGLGAKQFLAFVATTTASASSRFADLTAPRARRDGAIVTHDLTRFGLSTGTEAPLDQKANGSYAAEAVFTGAPAGNVTASSSDNCANWADPSGTARPGEAALVGTPALAFGPLVSCASQFPVYCIEN
jgi:hypothetical protein